MQLSLQSIRGPFSLCRLQALKDLKLGLEPGQVNEEGIGVTREDVVYMIYVKAKIGLGPRIPELAIFL